MKKEIKNESNEPVEFQLADHPVRCVEKVGGWPGGFDKKRIVRRRREFFLALDPNDDLDRAIFSRWFPPGMLLLNGHSGAQLAGFSPAFARPEAEDLLMAIREARPEIAKMETDRAQTAAEAAIMRAAAEENENPASVELFFEQIEGRERSVKLLDMKISTLRRKLANDQRRLLQILAEEKARQFEAEKSALKAELNEANRSIAAGFVQAAAAGSRLRRMSELVGPGQEWLPHFTRSRMPVGGPDAARLLTRPVFRIQATEVRLELEPNSKLEEK